MRNGLKKELNVYLINLKQQLQSFAQDIKQNLHELLKRGGMKLKLIGFVSLLITVTVWIVSGFIIGVTTTSIEQKAFEVATSSLERISDFSTQALLERSYENRINLTEMIKEIQESKTEGFRDISIYIRQKNNDRYEFQYFAGFKPSPQKNLEDTLLIQKLNQPVKIQTWYDEDKQTYRFIEPIYYVFQKNPILLGVVILQYDKEAIYGVTHKAVWYSIAITFVMVALSIAVIYFAGLQFTRPILQITEAAISVAEGDLNIDPLEIHTQDEIEELSNRFNKMVIGLREREKMQKYVSNSTISMIRSDQNSSLMLGGKYCSLAFLFSDIRGFTAMSTERKPNEMVEIVNFYLNLQSEIIKEHGGDIDKFVGDEIMASFSGENAHTKAVECSIAIQKILLDVNQERNENNQAVCNVGIGVNHGEVIVGNIGSNERMDFTSIGTEVNLAARLCSHAKAGEILIAKQSYENSNMPLQMQPSYEMSIKGMKKEVEVISIVVGDLS